MADDAEVERVARMMHGAFRDWHTTAAVTDGHTEPWEELRPRVRDAYLHVARAVLADRERCDPAAVPAVVVSQEAIDWLARHSASRPDEPTRVTVTDDDTE